LTGYIQAPSPNFDRRLAPPDMIVLHYTGMVDGAAALARLTDPDARVSAHYLVEEDGRIFALVPEARRAWHAGRSFWAGKTDINGGSIGVEVVNPGHEFGYRPFPPPQVAAVIDLLGDIRARWTVPDARILGHSDVAPDRKTDPGELFPWKSLAQAGHGLWVEPAPAPGSGPPGLRLSTDRALRCRPGRAGPRLSAALAAGAGRRRRRRRDPGAADGAAAGREGRLIPPAAVSV
jgi:N-acetylmuramoyl-L-alanine amidase